MMSADLQRKTATLSLTLQQLNIVRELLQINLPNHQVWAFGSRVAGHARKYPDLDLAVSHAEALFFQQLCQLSTAFKNSDLDICVDIVGWSHAEPAFRQSVEQRGMLHLR